MSTPNTPASNNFVLVQAATQAEDAMREMFRYYDGGETRGSYDGKPERAGLRKAWYALRSVLAAAPASPEPASNEAPGRGGTSGNVTLYREIDALGGYHDPEDQRDVGYGEALTAVLAILQRRGFSEHVEAVPAPIVGGTSACPICGEDKPHHHTAKVVDAYQHKGSRA